MVLARTDGADAGCAAGSRVVGRCVDVFLHEDSPFAREHRHRIRMGDKLSSPNFTYMMDLVTKLVCSVELEREVEPPHQEVPAPTQLPVVGVLDNTSANMVRHKLFIKKLLVDVVNPPKTRQLLQHLSWNHPRLSCLVLTAACEVVESEEEYGVLFQILKSLINLQVCCRLSWQGCFLCWQRCYLCWQRCRLC